LYFASAALCCRKAFWCAAFALSDSANARSAAARCSAISSEGEAYARKLKAAGVAVDAVRYDGTIHDFVLLNALRDLPLTEAAIDQASEGIRQHLRSPKVLAEQDR
jgi:acetyl esterase/lipase